MSEAERAVEELAAQRTAWTRRDTAGRVRLLEAATAGVLAEAPEWVRLACEAQGVDPHSAAAGEHWLSGPAVTLRGLRLLAGALRAGGAPRIPAMSRGPDGREVARVLPNGLQERWMFPGVEAEVWLAPGEELKQGGSLRRPARLGAVLGAGNISSIAPTDLASKLFVENQVCVLKTNPVNEYLAPVFERAFGSWIEAGALRIVTGGAAVGAALCEHPEMEAIHLTGSARTHDAILFGSDGAERARRKAAGTPRELIAGKEVTSELGCVTPILVVPGPWGAAALEEQARSVAGMVTHNGSFNCNAAQVLVLAEGWPRTGEFLDRLRAALELAPARPPYYPGAADRYAAFCERYPQHEPLGEGELPWTLIDGVPQREGEMALQEEAFCGVLAVTHLPCGSAADFLEQAVPFCNDLVWGTLSCGVLIDPSTRRALGPAFERALADLRYGGVAVNAWPGMIFGLMAPSWGAYPGHTLAEIGSGIGVVHNSFLIDRPEKSVLRAPFRMRPKPVWRPDHRSLSSLGPAATRYEARPGWGRFLGLLPPALRA